MGAIGLLLGPASRELGRELEAALDLPAIYAKLRTFPDGEVCVRSSFSHTLETVIIVQGTHPPQDQHLQELYQLVDIATSEGCRHIVCITPYLAYARQDKRTVPGEPLSARVVLRCLAALGANRLITVDVHNQRIFDQAPLDAVNLSVNRLFVNWLSGQKLHEPILVSPDAGGAHRLKEIGESLGWPTLVLRKLKDESGRTWYEESVSQVRGRPAIVVDDLCSSGSTFLPLAKLLLDSEASSIHYGVVHFFADPETIMNKLGRRIEIFATDSVPNPVASISLAPLIADFIRTNYLSSPIRDT